MLITVILILLIGCGELSKEETKWFNYDKETNT